MHYVFISAEKAGDNKMTTPDVDKTKNVFEAQNQELPVKKSKEMKVSTRK